jgi:hypothetical protein
MAPPLCAHDALQQAHSPPLFWPISQATRAAAQQHGERRSTRGAGRPSLAKHHPGTMDCSPPPQPLPPAARPPGPPPSSLLQVVCTATGATRQVLQSVCGHAPRGQLLGLLGPSGSGKTSLLDALAGRSRAQVSGEVGHPPRWRPLMRLALPGPYAAAAAELQAPCRRLPALALHPTASKQAWPRGRGRLAGTAAAAAAAAPPLQQQCAHAAGRPGAPLLRQPPAHPPHHLPAHRLRPAVHAAARQPHGV